MTACCQSPAQPLDYCANSYHIYLSTLGFRGCGKEISQICLCPFCPINTSFSGTPSSSVILQPQNPLPWRRHFSRTPRTLARTSSNNPRVFDLLSCEEMAINFVVPEVSPTSLLFLLHPCSSAVHLTEYFFFLFYLLLFFLHPKTSRICPIESPSPPINHTSNVSVR